ncbi:hypothetical protein Tco_0980596, partial [Tanacetum coccineum]
YALTKNPTIYVSLIEKFWQTTVDNGEQEIIAIVDGKEFTITKASVRRHLQLADVDGISVLPTTKIFAQLSLMGYVSTDDKLTFQKDKNKRFLNPHNRKYIAPALTLKLFSNMKRGFSEEHTPLFPSMLAIQAEEVEGSGHPSEPQPPPFTAQPTNEEPILNVVSSSHQKTQTPRSERVPTQSYDSPLPRVHTLGSDEGSMTLLELIVLHTTLSKKVESLETDLKQTKKVYGAPYTKLIKKVKKLEKTVKSNQARRAKIVVLDDEEDLEDSSKQGRMIEEIDQDTGVTLFTPTYSQEDQPEGQLGVFSAAKVLVDAAKENVHTYTRRRRAVSTGSGGISTAEESISTAGTSMPVSTAGMVQEVNISIPSLVIVKDKGKGKMEESEDEQSKRTKLQQEQERLGHEVALRLQEELDEEERQRISNSIFY